MTTFDKLLDDVCESPEDWTLRSILADFCDDNGRHEEAECLRWMVENHKRPYSTSTKTGVWFDQTTIEEGAGDEESDLPQWLFLALTGGEGSTVRSRLGKFCQRRYASPRAAEEAILRAWVDLRKSGWMYHDSERS